MRIQKVDEHTIRIFISFNELADRDITITDLFMRSPKTEQLFWELIAQAREEVEFSLDQPFWIQATLASNEEFVITVMKQDEQIEVSVKEKTKKKSAKNKKAEWVYVFGEFEDLLNAVKRLPDFSQLRSDLYVYEGEYYLVLNRLGSGQKRQHAEAVLNEYGESVVMTKAFLVEHGKPIMQSKAVARLIEIFSKAEEPQ